jgi:hypothetical protein
VEYTIVFGGEPQDVTITTSGWADREVFLRFNKELVADERFEPGMAILVDHTDLDATALTSYDVEAIGNSVKRISDRLGESLIAVVGEDWVTFGLARESLALAGPIPSRFGIFHTREEAIEWLRAQKAAESEAATED